MPDSVRNEAPQEVSLSGDLAEFRIALQEEIKAAQRQASADAISLSNGKFVGKIGHISQSDSRSIPS